MAKERLTIGELSRRSGVPVKTLRYWSDEGLLPTAGRSRSNYRLYGEEALVRLDLVRTLREAGLPIESIQKVLRREMSLADALRLRLGAVEAHVVSLQRVAAALRAALRSEPTDADIRRITAVTRLSNEERKAVIERFYDRVSKDIPIAEEWRQKMIAASTPELPENPTPEQLDAWIELAELMNDTKFIEGLRDNAKEVWGKFDMEKMRAAGDECAVAAAEAIAKGHGPRSPEARVVIEDYAKKLLDARHEGGTFGPKTMRGMRERFARQDPRASRYWELVSTMRGGPSKPSMVAEWNWIREAVLHHFANA